MRHTLLLTLFCLSGFQAYSQDFYGNGIQEVRIEFAQKNWDVKLDSLKKVNPDARLLATAWVNGQRFDSVGVRYKGNSSYFRTRNETLKKLPMNIKLDFKKKGQTLKNGQNTIKLSNAFLDPSFLRDPLSYEVIRKYMPAPQCNFAKVYLNGKYWGVYVNSESVDNAFIKKHFGIEGGQIVKCDPDNWKKVRSQTGCPKGENASLTYLNDNAGCYDAFYEVENPVAWKLLINLIKVLNKTPDQIETVLDVDQALWMLALNNALVNLDSYNGSLSHNYYLWFDSSNVAHPIIWDLNMSFGGWRRDFSFQEMTDDQLIQYSPLAEFENLRRPLISKLLKNSLYRKIYLAHLKTIVNEHLATGQLMTRAQSMIKEIDPWVKQDSLKLYTYADFQNSMDKSMKSGPDNVIGLKQLMTKRSEFLAKHPLMNKPQPTIAEPLAKKEDQKVKVTAKLTNATKGVWLFYRSKQQNAFMRAPMVDDGTNGDQAAGDGIYTTMLDSSLIKHWYVAAEGEEGAATLPERASFEYFKLD
ncbi:MAG: CotH kinase family protein [Saprospiraceae bacterium]|nr:CotH kinase family protein [Saprospiraceae bacterium]